MRCYKRLAFLLIAFGFVVSAHCQTYFVSAPMAGYCEVDVCDKSGGVPGEDHFGRTDRVDFGTLNETLNYDPVANTLEQVGSVSVSNSEFDLAFADAEYISSGTNLQLLTGEVGVSLTIGTIALDYSSGGTNNSSVSMIIPITGSYTFTTGGDEYAGALNYSLRANLFTTISSVTSTSLTFSQSAPAPFGAGVGPLLASVTASNGFRFYLIGGAADGYYFYDMSVGPVTAELVPEPTSFALVVFSAIGLTFWLMRGVLVVVARARER